MEADQTPPKPAKKRVRKPRGRGLRTKTGCLTCRKRHKKCDERMPICGPCIVSNRECTYPEDVEALRAQPSTASASPSHPEAEASNSNQPNHHPQHHPQAQLAHHPQQHHLLNQVLHHGGIPTLEDGAGPRLPAASMAPGMSYTPNAPSNPQARDIVDPALVGMYPDARFKTAAPPQAQYHLQGSYAAGPADHSQYAPSPDTAASSDLVDLASFRWFDLLATDAAQQGPDGRFSLSQGAPSDGDTSSLHLPDGLGSASRPYEDHPSARLAANLVDLSIPDRNSYPPAAEIKLSAHEAALLRNFAEKTASMLDVFDPQKHFSTYVTRLAMRNQGLMQAILAFSARYSQIAATTRAGSNPALGLEPLADPSEAIQHYNEGLNHLHTALRLGSTKSEELLSMALVISTYEMLETGINHNPNSNWQRHLEGVFSLQHARNVNGESGGLRGAAWWAWLRQDLWAAFRERRKCFSTWRPTVDYPDLRQSDMPDRAIYLLSLAVDYCAEPSPNPQVEPDKAAKSARRAAELMDMLERWKSFLGDAYKALPTANRAAIHGWTPTWVHPPEYGVALQVYSFAKILICMRRPVVNEFNDYIIAEAVATICGIAMELTDLSCQVISSQCLFAAGLCVQDPRQQHTIMGLIDACEARTGWPMDNLRTCLFKQWKGPKE